MRFPITLLLTLSIPMLIQGCALPLSAIEEENTMTLAPYPSSPRGTFTETLHGEVIADPYRWLEDDESREVIAWTEAQNTYTARHLPLAQCSDHRRRGLERAFEVGSLDTPTVAEGEPSARASARPRSAQPDDPGGRQQRRSQGAH